MYSIKTLQNGLRLMLAPNKGTEAATLLVLVKVGSRYESPELSGASHFLEHMMFKGTAKRKTAREISALLDRYGAEYNAFTTKDHTGYYVKIAAKELAVATDLLSDMLFHSRLDEVEMKREKKVIVEEINMYMDNPRMHIGDLTEEAMFPGATLGWKIGGTTKSVSGMKRSQVLAYKKHYYIPERMVVVLSGNFEEAQVKEVERIFGAVPKTKSRTDHDFDVLPTYTKKGPTIALQSKQTEQVQLAVAFYGLPHGSEEIPALSLLTTILGGGMSSRLFVAVRERRGLAYSVGASLWNYEDIGGFEVHAGLAKPRFAEAAKTIVGELDKIISKGVTPKELTDAKTQLRGRLMLRLEDCHRRADFFGEQALFTPQKIQTVEQVLKDLDQVDRAEIKAIAERVLNRQNVSIGCIGPFKDKQEVLKHFI